MNNEAKYLEVVDEFLAEKASQGVPDGSFWQKICAAFRQYLRNRGFKIAYSDNDIQELFRQSLRSLQQNGDVGSSGSLRNLRGVRYAVAPVIEADKKWQNPDDDPRMIELENKKQQALKDTLNASMDNGQRFDDWDDEWSQCR